MQINRKREREREIPTLMILKCPPKRARLALVRRFYKYSRYRQVSPCKVILMEAPPIEGQCEQESASMHSGSVVVRVAVHGLYHMISRYAQAPHEF